MSYGYVYVASIGMGANKQQTMKAILEAEAYDGPSLILSYAPCINHGIKKGMGKTQEQTKLAVSSGYWPLFRYNPALAEEGKNPFTLDSKEPDGSLIEFLSGEIRYASLQRTFPEESKELTALLEKQYQERYDHLKRMAEWTVAEPALAEVPEEVSADDPKSSADMDSCTISGTAEHTRTGDEGEPCDDGRAGK